VRGIDINEKELNQAIRVFGSKSNIQFEIGSLSSCRNTNKFDIIIFAASIQYFPDFSQAIGDSLKILNPGGEIHILDTHFYHKNELQMAARRSRSYYHSIGFEKMAEWYFHHAMDSVKLFKHEVLYNPFQLKNRIFRRNDPFPWICIKE
jgi:ubiquinone/menaquinone biosynthesis C-methylase UbiE